MINFKKFISLKEELTSEQKQLVSNWPRDTEAIRHTDHYFGTGNDSKIEHLHSIVNKSYNSPEANKRAQNRLNRSKAYTPIKRQAIDSIFGLKK